MPSEPKKTNDDKPHYHGHRDRLRARFLEGQDDLPDYELLELVLFQCIPRKDVKPLAKSLLAEFTSLSGVLAAKKDQLIKIKGISDNTAIHLKACYALSKRLKQQQIEDKTVLGAWDAVLDYCHTAMAEEKREQFRVLYLNSKNVLIKDVVLQTGTINHTPVYPREVVKTALELSATAMILVHNHPSGDPAPSEDDMNMTEHIVEASHVMGITVHDHIIIGKDGHFSFRNQGLLDL